MSTWCAIFVILRLAIEKELEGWTQLHVGDRISLSTSSSVDDEDAAETLLVAE